VCSTCYAEQLEQHLLKCPVARRRAQVEEAPYYCFNLNLPAAATDTVEREDHEAGGGGGGGRRRPQETSLGKMDPSGEQTGEGGHNGERPARKKRTAAVPSVFATMPWADLQVLVAIVRQAHALHCREPLQTLVLRHPSCEPLFTPTKGYTHPAPR